MMLTVFSLICFLGFACGFNPRVKIIEGELSGTTYTLPNGRELLAFLGVPFAAPPTGSNRFKEPKPAEPWRGVKPATSVGNKCIQTTMTPKFIDGKYIETIGDEDCLFLNVFTPKIPQNLTNENDLMNVLVYIPGGGFMFGSNNEAYPDYISQNDDIVFVSINHRLGPLGFFSVGHPLAAGNNGLKDVAEALRWTQRNIRYFGGNAAKVTIFGCSSAGAIVHYLMLSPSTKGLFQSAISCGGSVSLPWTLQSSVVDKSKELASSLDCDYKKVSHMMSCLRNKPVKEIMTEGYGKYIREGHLIDFPYSPVIEPPHRNAFLSENPYTLLKKGKVKHIPWLIGVAENEGGIPGFDVIFNQTKIMRVNNQWNEIIPKIFKYSNLPSESRKDYISAAIRKYYFNNKPLSNQTAKNYFQAMGDRHFYNGIIATSKLHSSVSLGDSYCYKFYYKGSEVSSDLFANNDGKNYGSYHCEDNFYITKSFNGKSKTRNDKEMAKLLSSVFIAFMKNGNPRVSEIEAEWKPLSNNGPMNCLGIYSYTVQKMENIENYNTTNFWNSLLPLENYY